MAIRAEKLYNGAVMKTVYVGMSGGVDSSVAAALLKRQGYLVTGVYMKNWIADVAGVACSWRQDLDDARAAAAVLDIPFKVMDFQKEYRRQVVDVMVAEYAARPIRTCCATRRSSFGSFWRPRVRMARN